MVTTSKFKSMLNSVHVKFHALSKKIQIWWIWQ